MAWTTWSPTDLTAGIALSSSGGHANTIATSTAGGNPWVRSLDSFSTGKFYWEVLPTIWGDTFTQFGISTMGAGAPPGSLKAGLDKRGFITINGVGNAVLAVQITGWAVGIAWDAAAKLIWFRMTQGADQRWNASGTADPATGTGGLSLSALGLPMAAYFLTNISGDSATANFGDLGAFVLAVPSGFNAGLGSAPVVGSTQARALVLA